MQPHARVQRLAELTGGRFMRSQRSVPMVIVGNASACWFGKGGFFRVFYPKFSQNNPRPQKYDFVDSIRCARFMLAKWKEANAQA